MHIKNKFLRHFVTMNYHNSPETKPAVKVVDYSAKFFAKKAKVLLIIFWDTPSNQYNPR